MLNQTLLLGAVHLLASCAVTLGGAREKFEWTATQFLVGPEVGREDRCVSVKDPSVVHFGGKWHLFTTIRSEKRTHQIEYSNFERWDQANDAERHILALTNNYFCAPQVFFFSPQQQWYLIYQISMSDRKVSLQPAFSTSPSLSDPNAWSGPVPLFDQHPDNITQWIDFWVICDGAAAHLFFTSLDGKLWRSQTSLGEFPRGWTRPEVALQADIFEASHTYRLRDRGGYASLIEAQGPQGRRYYKAYYTRSLSGPWEAVADSYAHPFAGFENVWFSGERWSDSISHGELLRAGYDERLEADWKDLRFLFQGVADRDRLGKPYGAIPWRLGLIKRISR